MSRKATIVIALVMNALLIAFLFSTAQHGRNRGTGVCKEVVEHQERLPIENVLEEYVVPPVPEVVPADMMRITVKKGDMLDKIAKQYGMSVSQLMHVNHLVSDQLQEGQELFVSRIVHVMTPQEPLVQKENGASPEYYTVKEGDNPWTIANKNHLRFEEFVKLNGLDEQKAKRLRPGDRLRIR